jgi:hypothetical protein
MTALGSVRRSKGNRPSSKRPRQGHAHRGLLPPTTVFKGGDGSWREHGKSSTGRRRTVGPGRSG